MTALDTSVAVPSLVGWHEHHEACRRAARGALLPAHALVETFSVLTRLPAPHRLQSDVARSLLTARFGGARLLAAPAALQRSIVELAAASGISGGAIYDALVGLTARHHGEILLTRDRRAAVTYDRLSVKFTYVGP